MQCVVSHFPCSVGPAGQESGVLVHAVRFTLFPELWQPELIDRTGMLELMCPLKVPVSLESARSVGGYHTHSAQLLSRASVPSAPVSGSVLARCATSCTSRDRVVVPANSRRVKGYTKEVPSLR